MATAVSHSSQKASRHSARTNRPEHSRHKAGRAAPGLSCVARFERSAGVLADRGDLANQSPTAVTSQTNSPTALPHKTSGQHTITLQFHPNHNHQIKNQSAASKVPCRVSGLKLHGTTQKQCYNAKLARAVSHSSQKAPRHSARTNRPEHSRHKAGRAAPRAELRRPL